MKIIYTIIFICFLKRMNLISIKFSSNNNIKNENDQRDDINIHNKINFNKSINKPKFNEIKSMNEDLNDELDMFLNDFSHNNLIQNKSKNVKKISQSINKIEKSLKTIYIKNQLEIDFFKQKNILNMLKSRENFSEKRKFEIAKEKEIFLSNNNNYLLNHNNDDIFKVVFSNITNSDNSDVSLLDSYLEYVEKRGRLSIKPNIKNLNSSSWKFDSILREYVLPTDSKYFLKISISIF